MKKTSTKNLLMYAFIAVLLVGVVYSNTVYSESRIYKGISWYGLDSDPSWYKMNKAQFDVLTQQFPNCRLLVLPLSASASEDKIILLQNYVSWCESTNIKIIVSNYMKNLDESMITAYWVRLAGLFKGSDTILGFDLINEPWAFTYGNTLLPELYERVIDAIREVDPDRKCYVQSYLKHQEGYSWILTNPVERENIEYITHVYDTDFYASTPQWLEWSPVKDLYINHQYVEAKDRLRTVLYDRFGRYIAENDVDFAITEICTMTAIDATGNYVTNPEAEQYFKDLVDILDEWGCDWAYAHYYSPPSNTRLCNLLDGTGEPYPHADMVSELMK